MLDEHDVGRVLIQRPRRQLAQARPEHFDLPREHRLARRTADQVGRPQERAQRLAHSILRTRVVVEVHAGLAQPLGARALRNGHGRDDGDLVAALHEAPQQLKLARRPPGSAGGVRQLGREREQPHAASER